MKTGEARVWKGNFVAETTITSGPEGHVFQTCVRKAVRLPAFKKGDLGLQAERVAKIMLTPYGKDKKNEQSKSRSKKKR
ncbi:MAG: hypothetical protein WBK76_00490 [Candidatus Saccharimonadales bacterium]